jgi:hypothetical protein
MLPDPGCYEERYRLTGGITLRLVVGVFTIGVGLRWQSPAISATALILAIPMLLSALGIVFAMPGLIAIARRVTAFRADYAGITLADMPTNLAALRSRAMFIPWAEIDRIVLYPASGPAEPGADALVEGIAVQRREPATALVPGPARTARKITGWRLDRERLTAVTAAVAPGVRIVDAGVAAS